MRRYPSLTVYGVLAAAVTLLPACKNEQGPPPGPIGGVIPGQRAAQRSAIKVVNLLRLDERDRAFQTLDPAYEPVVTQLKIIDDARLRLIKALDESGHQNLATVLEHKELTASPLPVEIVPSTPKYLELDSDGTSAIIQYEVEYPDGKTKKVFAKAEKNEGITWRLTLPFVESPDQDVDMAKVADLAAEAEKASKELKKALDDVADQLEAGKMLTEEAITQRLMKASKGVGGVIQKLIYGKNYTKA